MKLHCKMKDLIISCLFSVWVCNATYCIKLLQVTLIVGINWLIPSHLLIFGSHAENVMWEAWPKRAWGLMRRRKTGDWEMTGKQSGYGRQKWLLAVRDNFIYFCVIVITLFFVVQIDQDLIIGLVWHSEARLVIKIICIIYFKFTVTLDCLFTV